MSTRICVKGLPARLYNENQLEKKFSECGLITSIDLPALAKGKSSGVAFVGFKDQQSASKAIELFNKTFMGTTRIQVEIAQPIENFARKRPAAVEEPKSNPRNVKKSKKNVAAAATPVEESPKNPMIEKIAKNGRLWLQNLAHCCTEEDIRELIGNEDTQELRCIFNKKTGDCNGNAYITFTDPNKAIEVYGKLDGSNFMGRKLKIFSCDDRQELSISKKLQNLPFVPKSHIDHGTKSWNALFIGGDVVAETFSKKLEMEKSKLLEGSKDLPPATALALAEVRILREIRQFLLDNDVNIHCFGTEQERSRTILIAKNLPTDFTDQDVQRTFKPFGTMKRMIFNNEIGLTAIIELNESAAKSAFDRINGAMIRGRPLKLEFAPKTIFDKPPTPDAKKPESLQKKLIIRNLPFTIKESELLPLMKAVGEVKEIRLPENVNGQKRGFGFVEFVDTGDVKKALELFEGVHYSGRRMVVEISTVEETVKEGKIVEKKKQKLNRKQLNEAMSSMRQDF